MNRRNNQNKLIHVRHGDFFCTLFIWFQNRLTILSWKILETSCSVNDNVGFDNHRKIVLLIFSFHNSFMSEYKSKVILLTIPQRQLQKYWKVKIGFLQKKHGECRKTYTDMLKVLILCFAFHLISHRQIGVEHNTKRTPYFFSWAHCLARNAKKR